ncbi:MAG: hypothetical protein ACYDDU_09120 [Dermatophilaceae bacterium]
MSLQAITAYGIALDELHDDSTSLALYGAYRDAHGEPTGGVTPARPARGFSKDHRPDLLQLVWALTISADGAVPVTYRLLDGNTEDSTTHIATWQACRALAGRAGFLYAALSCPEHAGLIQRVLAIPEKHTNRAIVCYLTHAEVDALLTSPDRST